MATKPRQTAAHEALDIVFGDRAANYGHPRENFDRIARYWSVWKGIEFTPSDVAWMMALVKVARQMHKPGHDNRVDAIGYILTDERLDEAPVQKEAP